MEQKQDKVFISFSNKDKTIADFICKHLESNNIPCWIAHRDIRPGYEYAAAITSALEMCNLIVLVYSQHSNESRHVRSEIAIAFDKKKPIVSFLIDDTKMNESFVYYLNRDHWLIAYPDYTKRIGNLIDAIKNLVNNESQQELKKAESYDGTGYEYLKDDKLSLAIANFLKALGIRERILGNNHVDLAISYDNLAKVYVEDFEYDEALDYYKQALEIRKNAFGDNHQDTATSYDNVGFIYEDQGEYEQAYDFALRKA